MGFLRPKTPQAQEPERLTSVQVNQSAYGRAVPLAYGVCRVAINMLWYSDFEAIPIQMKQSGGGKGGGGGRSTTTSFEYKAAFILGACEGPVSAIPRMFMDKSQADPVVFGFQVFLGTATQAVWSHLTTHHGAPEQIPYNLHAYLAASAFNLGGSAALPNLSVEVRGFSIEGAGVDAEPSNVVVDYCTSPTHGCNFPFLDTSGFTSGAASWRTYNLAMDFLISPLEVEQRPAVDFLNYICQITNSAPVWSAGLLKIRPYGDQQVVGALATYTPNMTPVYTFNDDDYLYSEGEDPIRVVLKSPAQTFNSIKIEFLDRSRDYNPGIADAKSDEDIRLNGLRQAPTMNMHAITRVEMARTVAQIGLQRSIYIKEYYKFRTRFDYCLLEPMDLVALNDSTQGIVSVLARIVDIDDSADDELAFTCEEVPIGPAGAPLYNTQLAAGYNENYYADPGSVQPPLIFQIPPLLAVSINRYLISIAIAGAGAMWAGCDVYISYDNLRYQFLGTHYGPSRYGSLVNTLPSVADPDTSSVLRVQLTDTRLELLDGSQEDADENRTLCYVDGEIVSYRDSTLTATPGQYDLQYLRRGQYGSTRAAHTPGANKFARIDQSLFSFAFDPGMIGRTMFFKFASFNIFGVRSQSIDALAPYTHVVKGSFSPTSLADNATFIPRGSCGVSGNALFKSAATSLPGAFDGSNVYSLEGYSDGAHISFRPNELSSEIYVGFNSEPITDTTPSGIAFAYHLLPGGSLQIAANGTDLLSTPDTYTETSLLEIDFDGQVVKFFKNGALILQAPRETQLPQFFDSYFKQPSSSIRDVKYAPLNRSATVPFVARNTCFANINTMGKLSIGADAYDSDVYSAQSYAEGCALSFQPTQLTALFFIGLNSDPTTDQNFTGIDYAWQCNATPECVIYESGTLILNCGSYTTTTTLSIRYDGQNIQYLKDGVVQRQIEAKNKNLFLDSSWRTPGGQARNVEFSQLNPGPQVPFIATGAVMVSNNGARVRCVAPPTVSSGTFYSRQSHANGCIVSFQAEQTGSPATSTCDIGLDTTPIAGGAIDYAWSLVAANDVVTKDGAVVSTFSPHTLDTVLQVAYDGKFVIFLRDGVIVKQFPDPGKTFFAYGTLSSNGPDRGARNITFEPYGVTQPDPFIARGNCQITGNTIEKFGGSSAWDSDVYSVVGFPTCHVQFKTSVASGTNRFMIGFSANPTDSVSFTGIQYALYANGTDVRIYEAGTEISTHGALTTSTLLSMTYDGSNVRYYKDDVLLRTIAASGNKFFDSSFFDPGTKANAIEFGPGIVLPKIDTLQLFPTSATNMFMVTQPDTTIVAVIAFDTDEVYNISIPAMQRAYTAAVGCDFGLSVGAAGGLVFLTSSAGSPATSVKKPANTNGFIQADFTVPAATPCTFALNFTNNTAASAFFSTIILKAEIIKA